MDLYRKVRLACAEGMDTAAPEVPMQVAPIRIVRGTIVIELEHDAPATRVAEIVRALEVQPC